MDTIITLKNAINGKRNVKLKIGQDIAYLATLELELKLDKH